MSANPFQDDYPLHPERIHGPPSTAAEHERRQATLEKLRSLLAVEADGYLSDPRLSHRDDSWLDWQERTGELPPDFEQLPAIADLPNPLVQYGNEPEHRTKITTKEGWEQQRDRYKEQLEYWLYGQMPPAPENVRATELEERPAEGATIRVVRLEFGPDHDATLTLEVMIPDGTGPFPVFMTQWNHRKWALLALQRGYVGVVYAAADARDDAADYGELYPNYDFQLLSRRAWAAHRVVDYLETLPEADDNRIGITGASRNGKQSLIAAAFDERIDAVAPCSAGSGAVVPARFDRDDCYAGDMAVHARLRRSWFHPRWRFFVGRENHLPVDANHLVSLVAPRACLLDTALNERTTSAWAVDRVYQSASSVYDLLDATEDLAVRYRQGRHARATRDVHQVLNFFDETFGIGEYEAPSRRYHDFSFEEWRRTAAEVDVTEFPKRDLDTLLKDEDGYAIDTVDSWTERKPAIRERICWSFGDRPPRASSPSESSLDAVSRGGKPDYLADVIGRPEPSAAVGKRWLSHSQTYGKRVDGDLYYPKTGDSDHPEGELPAVIWLHPYSYNTGYGAGGRGQVPVTSAIDRGFALYAFDQLGFGTRIGESEHFYNRHPNWSKMGKMVDDTLAAVETLSALECIDSDRIFIMGYSLGATVGLYAAALDERIKGVASVCGFAPFRTSDSEMERANAVIGRLSHIHGLQPRLGLFRDDPERMPFDFHEVLGLIAPRPLLAVAPSLDWTHPQKEVLRCVDEARSVYDLYDEPGALEVHAPDDLLSFDYHEARLANEPGDTSEAFFTDRRNTVFDWLAEQV
ncbi:alpha/beta fold hydrolase [Natronorubrum halophilum]|uniref:alpha/beta fold hydrolase n=1 Tax=Natronorubrum halophilum TaxID=1702106 RepID=UPI0010C1FC31|nr:alpha/beta fold hydrolase [Natronorubrum halophilum]